MACFDCPEPSKRAMDEQRGVGWKAWYTQGRTFEGTEADWAKLPDDGALGFKLFFNDGRSRQIMGDDWYGLLVLAPGEWTIIHNSHPRAENEERYPGAIWRRGQWTSDAEIQRVMLEMTV